jgi:hypothetical protein
MMMCTPAKLSLRNCFADPGGAVKYEHGIFHVAGLIALR